MREQYVPVPIWQLQKLGEWADWLESINVDADTTITRMVSFLRSVGLPHDAILEMEAKK